MSEDTSPRHPLSKRALDKLNKERQRITNEEYYQNRPQELTAARESAEQNEEVAKRHLAEEGSMASKKNHEQALEDMRNARFEEKQGQRYANMPSEERANAKDELFQDKERLYKKANEDNLTVCSKCDKLKPAGPTCPYCQNEVDPLGERQEEYSRAKESNLPGGGNINPRSGVDERVDDASRDSVKPKKENTEKFDKVPDSSTVAAAAATGGVAGAATAAADSSGVKDKALDAALGGENVEKIKAAQRLAQMGANIVQGITQALNWTISALLNPATWVVLGVVLVLFTGLLFAVSTNQIYGQNPHACKTQEECEALDMAANCQMQASINDYVPGTLTVKNVKMNAEQKKIAIIVIQKGKDLNVNANGIAIALSTAIVESTMTNLPDGHADSAGVFQQRPSMDWGTYAQVTNPEYASKKFYETLLGWTHYSSVPGKSGSLPDWKNRTDLTDEDLGDIAQSVQRSGVPDAYEGHMAEAKNIYATLQGGVVSTAGSTSVECENLATNVNYAGSCGDACNKTLQRAAESVGNCGKNIGPSPKGDYKWDNECYGFTSRAFGPNGVGAARGKSANCYYPSCFLNSYKTDPNVHKINDWKNVPAGSIVLIHGASYNSEWGHAMVSAGGGKYYTTLWSDYKGTCITLMDYTGNASVTAQSYWVDPGWLWG